MHGQTKTGERRLTILRCFGSTMKVMVAAIIMACNFCAITTPSFADLVADNSLTLRILAPVWMRLIDSEGAVLAERIYERDDEIEVAQDQILTARIGNIRCIEFCFADGCYIASSDAPFGPVAVELTWTKLKVDLIASPLTLEGCNNDAGGPLFLDPDLELPSSIVAFGVD